MKKSKLLLSLGGLLSCVLFGQGFAAPQWTTQTHIEVDVSNPLQNVNLIHKFAGITEDIYKNGVNVKNTVTWTSDASDWWRLTFNYNGHGYATYLGFKNCTMKTIDSTHGVKIQVDNLDLPVVPGKSYVHIIMDSGNCDMEMV